MSRKIAIVGGTGPQGTGLALRWARAGEDIVIGSRDEHRGVQAAAAIAERTGSKSVVGAENKAAVQAADVVVLTVPFEGQAEMLKHIKPALRAGQILIDATVPLASAVGGRATRVLGVWQGSAVQQTAELVPKDVAVVAAFQNVSASHLNEEKPIDCDVLICTDDENARKTTAELVEKIPGLKAVDAGKLENCRIVEQITALLISLNIRHKLQGAGFRITGLDDKR